MPLQKAATSGSGACPETALGELRAIGRLGGTAFQHHAPASGTISPSPDGFLTYQAQHRGGPVAPVSAMGYPWDLF